MQRCRASKTKTSTPGCHIFRGGGGSAELCRPSPVSTGYVAGGASGAQNPPGPSTSGPRSQAASKLSLPARWGCERTVSQAKQGRGGAGAGQQRRSSSAASRAAAGASGAQELRHVTAVRRTLRTQAGAAGSCLGTRYVPFRLPSNTTSPEWGNWPQLPGSRQAFPGISATLLSQR